MYMCGILHLAARTHVVGKFYHIHATYVVIHKLLDCPFASELCDYILEKQRERHTFIKDYRIILHLRTGRIQALLG